MSDARKRCVKKVKRSESAAPIRGSISSEYEFSPSAEDASPTIGPAAGAAGAAGAAEVPAGPATPAGPGTTAGIVPLGDCASASGCSREEA